MIPFAKILPCIVLGILLAGWAPMPPWMVWALLAAAWAMGWLTWRRGAAGQVYAALALVLGGMAMAQWHAPAPELPQGERVELHLRVTDNPYSSGRWQQTTARVRYYRGAADSLWRAADEKILLSIDTALPAAVGRELICRSWVNAIDRGGDSLDGWARLMNVRGIFSRVYITDYQLLAMAPERPMGLATIAKKWQRAASDRLAHLDLTPEQLAVATTMTTGERRGLPRELREAYSRVGTSHLLAVSGLHVGIVFVLVNLLLWPLALLRRGGWVRNVVAIVTIWAFAAMTGLSPSAMRAALMFTGAQAAIATSSQRSALNILLATCSVMLLLNPSNLYDVSFQLSALAMLFILMLCPPLYRRLKTRFGVLNFAIGGALVTLAATLGTAPLVAYYFGNFPLVGLPANLPVVLTAHAIVLASLAWILLPVVALAPIMSAVVGAATGIQNALVAWFAAWPTAALEVSLSGWGMAAIYGIYGVIFIAIRYASRRF